MNFWRKAGLEIKKYIIYLCPELLFATQDRGVVSQRHATSGSHDVNIVCAVPLFCVAPGGVLAPHLLRHITTVLRRVSGESASVTQQT